MRSTFTSAVVFVLTVLLVIGCSTGSPERPGARSTSPMWLTTRTPTHDEFTTVQAGNRSANTEATDDTDRELQEFGVSGGSLEPTAAMAALKRAGLEQKLENWAQTPPEPMSIVQRHAALTLHLANAVNWSAVERRALDPQRFDQLVAEFRDASTALLKAARGNDRPRVQATASSLLATCVDCHTTFR